MFWRYWNEIISESKVVLLTNHYGKFLVSYFNWFKKNKSKYQNFWMNFLKNELLQNDIQVVRYSNQTDYISGSLIGSNLFVDRRLTGHQVWLQSD